jgi:transcription-repair coupling factor (superfamily II helicase)
VPSDRRRLEVYRRAATVQAPAGVEQLRADLTSAYGEPPEAVKRLLDVAEIRAMAGVLGARSMEIAGPDLVVRCRSTAPFHEAFRGMQGTVRDVGGAGPDGLRDVYVRPPKAFLEPASLMAVLRKRLGPMAAEAAATLAWS